MNRSSTATWLLLTGLLVGGTLVALVVGAAHVGPRQVLAFVTGSADATTRAILGAVRFPRVLLAVFVGAALGVSGAALQSTLRNPLAEPYLLGVSGGAAVGAVLVVVAGLPVVALGAFAGALTAVALTLAIAHSVRGTGDTRTLLLSGVVLGAFANAAIMILLTTAPEQTVRGALWWMMGSTSSAAWRDVFTMAVALAVGASALLVLAPRLDALGLGTEAAASLGVHPERTAWWAFAAASLLAAVSVSVVGLVGFVGLVVPNLARAIQPGGVRSTLMTSGLLGALLTVLADTVARTVMVPAELPLGAVTAILGVPFFLWQLRRGRGA